MIMREIGRAVISGASCSMGTALVRQMTEKGISVTVLCRRGSTRNSEFENMPGVSIRYLEMSEYSAAQNDTGEKYDVFFHLAWDDRKSPRTRNDVYLQKENLGYALDAVGLAYRLGCHTFVGLGSQAEYGRYEGKLTGKTPTFPETAYGAAKLCAGEMTRIEAHRLGMAHEWVRVLSVFGPKDSENTMIKSAIVKLTGGEVPQFTKGEQKWDYLFCEDAARALFSVAKSGVDGKIYPLGSGVARPLSEYICEIRDTVSPGAKIDLGAVPYAPGQVMYLCADISELTADTGFVPITSFSDGIKSFIEKG